MQRLDITPAEIDRLVVAFYERIRSHETLGPIFNKAIGLDADSWRHHEAKIASFWRGVAGIDRSYAGTPMRVHMENLDVQPELFPVWLALFRHVANEVLPEGRAQGICAMADRIGQGLALGVANGRLKRGAAPVFLND